MEVPLIVLAVCLAGASAHAEVIRFQCSWNDERPFNIRVDTATGKATRDDGGKSYTVIKATKWAVWLMIDEPENVAGMRFQMIQRAEAIRPLLSSVGCLVSGPTSSHRRTLKPSATQPGWTSLAPASTLS
jgi:hypothetical protein